MDDESMLRKGYYRGICLVALVLAADCCRGEPLMKFDSVTYTVAEMMGPPQTLTIQADGQARYESHSNNSMPDTPEIGFYETKLPSAEMEILNRVLTGPTFESSPDHSGRIAAGDRYKTVTISWGSRTVKKVTGSSEPVDPSLAKVLKQLDQIVAQVMGHPRQTLQLEISHIVLGPSGTLAVDFALSNGGTEEIECANPLLLSGGPRLSFRGWPDKPPSRFLSGEVFRVDVQSVTKQSEPSSDLAIAPLISIEPGQRIAFRASLHLSVPAPETYLTQLAYENTAETPSRHRVIIGELFSKITKLQVPAQELHR